MRQFTFYANRPVENYHKVDMWLLVSILLLWGLGFFTLFVCSQNYAERAFGDSLYFIKRQFISSVIGFVLLISLLVIDMKYIRKLVPAILLLALILCFMTFFSEERNGAKRWIHLPAGFTFQPSEFAKFAIVLFLANYFDKQEKIENPEEKTVFPCVIVFISFVIMILGQKDFSTGVFIAGAGILLFIVAGAKIAWLIPFGVMAIPAAFLLVALEPYRLQRVIGWIKPDEFATSINYQSIAAKRAISAGGLWGNGIGAGLTRINNIPEIQADYIFAGWAEAMGFIGVILYLGLLVFFAVRGYRTALLCKNRFTAYGSFGCVSIIFLQSLLNIMVVGGILPTTGIPLPFFSLGGSSIIITLAMCGFLLNASRCEEFSEKSSVDIDDINMEPFSYL